MIHLTPADYLRMPWANGRGTTVEMMRVNRFDGGLLWRLSMASVVDDGPFSLFPGVDRNLTVISGPGFWLTGDAVSLDARLLVPVAFPGDIPLRAQGTGGVASDDFNVMADRSLPKPDVTVLQAGVVPAGGGTLCVFALGEAMADGRMLGQHDLIISKADLDITGGGPLIAVRLAL